ncbi:MAG: ABC transporter permease [Sphaerochaetaceae bacterium]|nr:ABC transporter permease [Sphaerochaetaceae bacterium]
MFFENIKLAFKSMLSNKMRTFLSLLGIVIGVGSVVAILTLGSSASGSITESLESGGIDTISLTATPTAKNYDTFDELLGQELMENIDGIENVINVNSTRARIRNGKIIKTASVYGVSSDYSSEVNYTVKEGSWFTSDDNIERHQVVVLGSSIAEDLFPDESAVGKSVSVFREQGSKSYTVIGVMDDKDSSFTASYNDSLYIPYNTFTQRLQNAPYVGNYVIKVSEGYDAVSVSDNVSSYLDMLVGSDNFYVFSQANLTEIASSITGTFGTFLAAIAGISLLVGGIGIMNIMLVSVAERTKEIGIRKALGASPKVIRGQFITEAVVLTMVGGVLGIALGTGVSFLVCRLVNWAFAISLSSYVISVGFSTFIGLFFGWYPAKKAAKLDPIEALNYE